jgi:hypothetical protein
MAAFLAPGAAPAMAKPTLAILEGKIDTFRDCGSCSGRKCIKNNEQKEKM